jgi:hypothetical protein
MDDNVVVVFGSCCIVDVDVFIVFIFIVIGRGCFCFDWCYWFGFISMNTSNIGAVAVFHYKSSSHCIVIPGDDQQLVQQPTDQA